jgi:transmembrane sensor
MTATDDRVRDLITQQAAEWFIGNRAGLPAHQRQSFTAWLKASPLHVEEYLTLSVIARDLPEACEHSQSSLDELLARARSEPDAYVKQPEALPGFTVASWLRWQTVAVTLAALSVLSLGLLALWSLRPIANIAYRDDTTVVHFETRHGEQQTQRLADNSVLHLNTDTAVTIRFSKKERRVVLNAGEADFEVARERDRAFRVVAGAAQIVAIGTKFDVRLQQETTVVTVVQGRVAVGQLRPPDRPNTVPYPQPEFVQLGANQQINVTSGAWPAMAIAIDAQQTIAWLHRQIMFEHEPLERVASEFNRYAPTPFEITTPALRALEISGVFATDDTDAFIAFLRSLDGVHVEVTTTRIRVMQD